MKTIWRKPNASKSTRKAKSRTKIAGWMFKGILKASPDMGTAVLSGWMKSRIRSMAWGSQVADIAKETAAQLSIDERIIQRRVDGWYSKENERIAKMYQEVGL